MRGRFVVGLIVASLLGCGSSQTPENDATDRGMTVVNQVAFSDGSRDVGLRTSGPFSREEAPAGHFEDTGVSGFVDATADPLSTFGLDVDTASYSLLRGYLAGDHLLPSEAIRVEEFVNAFKQGYLPSSDALAIQLEAAPSPYSEEGRLLVRVGLEARPVKRTDRRDACVVLLVDVSGSMEDEDKLELARRALRLFVDDLRPTDLVAIVTFNDDAQVVLGPTPCSERARIHAALDEFESGGSTNVGAGLRLAYTQAATWFRWPDADTAPRPDRVCRVVLLTDGVANVGSTKADEILEQVRGHAREGIQLSALGVGMHGYNDALLERLADAGDGHYAYLDTLAEARRVLVEQATGTLQLVAKDARVQVVFDPAVVRRYRLVGYGDRELPDGAFRDDDHCDGGEVGAGHSVTALYELELEPGRSGPALVVHARWLDPDTGRPLEVVRSLMTAQARSSFERASPRFQLTAAVAELAEALRGSAWGRTPLVRLKAAVERLRLGALADDSAVVELSELLNGLCALPGKTAEIEERVSARARALESRNRERVLGPEDARLALIALVKKRSYHPLTLTLSRLEQGERRSSAPMTILGGGWYCNLEAKTFNFSVINPPIFYEISGTFEYEPSSGGWRACVRQERQT